jgi:hypothetical protein
MKHRSRVISGGTCLAFESGMAFALNGHPAVVPATLLPILGGELSHQSFHGAVDGIARWTKADGGLQVADSDDPAQPGFHP